MISVGSVIENREIISIFDNKYCLAKCLGESPDEFVVWNIDNDHNGVHTGRYYNNRMDAEWCYAALCFDWFEDNVHINMVEEKELTLFEKLNKEIEYAKTSLSPIELLYQAYGSIKMARNLEAISFDEYMTLNHLCVAEGINNPEYFNPKSQSKEVTPEQREHLVERSIEKAKLSRHQFLVPSK